jgi:hypothetical protein
MKNMNVLKKAIIMAKTRVTRLILTCRITFFSSCGNTSVLTIFSAGSTLIAFQFIVFNGVGIVVMGGGY